VRLSLAGEWWDSLLYMGRWYLVARDGSVRVVDWQNVIESLDVEDDLRLAVHCAFARGDALYGASFSTILRSALYFKASSNASAISLSPSPGGNSISRRSRTKTRVSPSPTATRSRTLEASGSPLPKGLK
jgi:hypothetical protein